MCALWRLVSQPCSTILYLANTSIPKNSLVADWSGLKPYQVQLCQCDQKKLPNVHKSCLKIISVEKWSILTPLQKVPKNVGDLDKLIVAKGFKKLPKVQ